MSAVNKAMLKRTFFDVSRELAGLQVRPRRPLIVTVTSRALDSQRGLYRNLHGKCSYCSWLDSDHKIDRQRAA